MIVWLRRAPNLLVLRFSIKYINSWTLIDCFHFCRYACPQIRRTQIFQKLFKSAFQLDKLIKMYFLFWFILVFNRNICCLVCVDVVRSSWTLKFFFLFSSYSCIRIAFYSAAFSRFKRKNILDVSYTRIRCWQTQQRTCAHRHTRGQHKNHAPQKQSRSQRCRFCVNHLYFILFFCFRIALRRLIVARSLLRFHGIVSVCLEILWWNRNVCCSFLFLTPERLWYTRNEGLNNTKKTI